MRMLLHRGRVALALQLVLGLVALSIAVAEPHRSPPPPRLALSTTGALAISNSKDGAMIFHGEGMRPGESAGGSVRIGNAGSASAALRLSRATTNSITGAGGAALDSRLQLLVIDKTRAQLPITVYAGDASSMPAIELGTLTRAETRDYQFVATLPDRGEGADNAYQGASLTQSFAWTARQAPGATDPTPTPGPIPAPAPALQPLPTPHRAPASPTPVTAESLIVLPSAHGCLKRRSILIRLRPRHGAAITAVDVRVGKRKPRHYSGNRRTLTIRMPLRGRRRVRVKVTVHRAAAAPVSLTRVYRPCKKRSAPR